MTAGTNPRLHANVTANMKSKSMPLIAHPIHAKNTARLVVTEKNSNPTAMLRSKRVIFHRLARHVRLAPVFAPNS